MPKIMRAETQESEEMSFSCEQRRLRGSPRKELTEVAALRPVCAPNAFWGKHVGTILLFFFLAFAPAWSSTVVSYLKNRSEKNAGHKCCHKIILLVLRSQGFNKAGV
eukprot:scaffold10487_cov163-Skeletonema_marinoi.AAC.2